MTDIEKHIFHAVTTILLALLAYIWQGNAVKLAEVDRSLQSLRIEIAEMQATIVTREEVRKMIREELELLKK